MNQQQQFNNEQEIQQQKHQYLFYWIPNNPSTLVLLKNISLISEHVSQYSQVILPNFIFLNEDYSEYEKRKRALTAMLNQGTNQKIMIQQFVKISQLRSDYMQKSQILQFHFQIYRMSDEQLLQQYTKQTFFHKIINKLLRAAKDVFQLYYIQYFVKRLFNIIKKSYILCQARLEQNMPFRCYRGAKLTQKQIEKFSKNKASYVQSLGFMSTSLQNNLYYAFINESRPVLFEIQVQSSNVQMAASSGYIHISNSSFEIEKEVLFNVNNIFQIVDVHSKQLYNDEGVLIVLKYQTTLPQNIQLQFKQANSQTDINMIDIMNQGDALASSSKQLRQLKKYYYEKLVQLYEAKDQLTKQQQVEYQNAVLKLYVIYISLNEISKDQQIQQCLSKFVGQMPNCDIILSIDEEQQLKKEVIKIFKYLRISSFVINLFTRINKLSQSLKIINNMLTVISISIKSISSLQFSITSQPQKWNTYFKKLQSEQKYFMFLKQLLFLTRQLFADFKIDEQQQLYCTYDDMKNKSRLLLSDFQKLKQSMHPQLNYKQKQVSNKLQSQSQSQSTVIESQCDEVQEKGNQKNVLKIVKVFQLFTTNIKNILLWSPAMCILKDIIYNKVERKSIYYFYFKYMFAILLEENRQYYAGQKVYQELLLQSQLCKQFQEERQKISNQYFKLREKFNTF